MHHAVPAAILAAILAPGPASPAIAAGAVECRTMGDQRVVLKVRPDAAGRDLMVRPGVGGPCLWNPTPHDFVLGAPERAYEPIAIDGGYLILDAGTGPARRLVVYDLSVGEMVLDVGYDDGPGLEFTEGAFSFLAATDMAVTAATCPDAVRIRRQGLLPALFERAVFDYATGTLERSGDRVCRATQ